VRTALVFDLFVNLLELRGFSREACGTRWRRVRTVRATDRIRTGDILDHNQVL
jgi:hypothetical protein